MELIETPGGTRWSPETVDGYLVEILEYLASDEPDYANYTLDQLLWS